MGVPGRHHERVPYRMALVHDDDRSGSSLYNTGRNWTFTRDMLQ